MSGIYTTYLTEFWSKILTCDTKK